MKISAYLGGGMYGRVYKAEIQSEEFPRLVGQTVAVKFYSMCQADFGSTTEAILGPLYSFYREAEVLSAIHRESAPSSQHSSEAVVDILGTFAYMADPLSPTHEYYPALVMEYAECGSVLDVMTNLAESKRSDPSIFATTCLLAWKMCKALKKMHASGFYQQDVKPANFLCFRPTSDDGVTVKLGDMGLTCTYKSIGPAISKCRPTGAPLYTSPEFVRLKGSGTSYVKDPQMIAASERYSLACSIRDMFWAIRRCLSDEDQASCKSCWKKAESRIQFVRESKRIFTSACLERLCGDSKPLARLAKEFDAVVYEMLSSNWERRPSLQDLEDSLRSLCEHLQV